jgi:hypothetical protein
MNKKHIAVRLLTAAANLQGKEATWQEMTRKCWEHQESLREQEHNFIKVLFSRSKRKEVYQPSSDQLKWLKHICSQVYFKQNNEYA